MAILAECIGWRGLAIYQWRLTQHCATTPLASTPHFTPHSTLQLDHHCPFVSKCIGKNNLCHFRYMGASFALNGLYTIGVSIIYSFIIGASNTIFDDR